MGELEPSKPADVITETFGESRSPQRYKMTPSNRPASVSIRGNPSIR